MAAAPFKVCIPSRGKCIGIAAHSYDHLREVLRTRYKIRGDFYLQQDDGTLVCDEDYFQLLEPNTKLTVVDAERPLSEDVHPCSKSAGIGVGEKGFSVVEADSSSLLPAAKRLCRESPYPPVSSKCYPYMHNMVGTLNHPLPQQMSCISQPSQMITPPQCRLGSLSSWPGAPQVRTSPPHIAPCPLPARRPSTTNTPPPSQLVPNTSPSSLISRLQIANVMSLSRPTQGHTPPSPASQPLVAPLPQPHPYITSPHQAQPGRSTSTHMYPGSVATGFIPATASRPMYLPSQPPRQPVQTVLFPTREQGGGYHLVPFQQVSQPVPQRPLQQLSQPVPQHPPSCQLPLPSASTAQQHSGVRGHYGVSPMPPALPTLRQMCTIPSSVQHVPTSRGCSPQSAQGVLPPCGLQQNLLAPTMDTRRQSQQILIPSVSNESAPCLHGNTTHPENATRPPSQYVPVSTSPAVTSVESLETSTPKKVLGVKVVQCLSDAVTSESSEDEEEEEEGNRLCIVEHSCPLSPDPEKAIELPPSPTEQSAQTEPVLHKKKIKPPDLLLCPSKPDPGLEYHPTTEDELEHGMGQPSPDEGYSSSPSPHELTKDFTSQLPFEGYERPQTPISAEQLQISDQWPDNDGDEIVDVVTVDEDEVESDASTGEAVVMSPWRKNSVEEETKEGEESDVDVECSFHLQDNDLLWEECEVLEHGSVIEVSSDDEVFPRTSETADSVMELIVSVPFAQLPRRSRRRKTSSTSSQSSVSSVVSPRTRQQRRRRGRRGSRASVSEELVVKIPLRHLEDVTHTGLLSGSFSEGAEDSDVPSTIEQVAASMQPPKPKQVHRLEPHFDLGSPPPQPQIIPLERHFNLSSPPPQPDIIRLEPHSNIASPPPQPLPFPKLAVEPKVEVAEYCCEVTVPTAGVLCSQHDLDSCLRELLDVVQQMRCSNDVAVGGEGIFLDVGDEVELREGSEDMCDDEMTGVDLLNLFGPKEIPEMEICVTGESNSHCEDTLEDEPYVWKVQTFVPDSTCYVCDPRQEIQRYSFGPNTCIELYRSHGEWKLQSI